MAAGVVDSSMTRLPAPSQLTRPGVRRATYVHVSDLTSAYNIDHARLEKELSRVKAEREATALSTKASDLEVDPIVDNALGSVPQKRLLPPRGGYNLCVLVGEVNVVVDKKRVDLSRVRLAEVEVGDETGTVSLRARDGQIDVLSEVSKRAGAVVLRNCTLELYQGKHVRLAVTKWGKLCVYPDSVASTPPPPSKMNYDRNFSLIDLSTVASELMGESPYLNRPSKFPEPPSPGGPSVPSKSGGQTHSRHQQSQSSQKRGSRDRRQRGRTGSGGGGGVTPPQAHYGGGPQADGGTMQSPTGQLRYQSMHGFSGYDQGMDPRQFSYPHSQQQEAITPASARQLMLHQSQQYEMQQRQLQQMYHGSQEPPRPGMGQSHQAQAPVMMLPPVVASGSFDATGEYQVSSYSTGGSDQHPSVMSVVGSSPILIPMTMAGARAPAGVSPAAAQEQYGLSGVAPQGSHIDQQPWHGMSESLGQAESQYMSVSPDDSQFSPGKMNPEATSFAPSYMNPNPQTAHQVYFPFDPSQSAAGGAYRPAPSPHLPAYPQGMMYLPAALTSPKSASISREAAHLGSSQTGGQGGASTGSQSSGKENVKSTRPEHSM